MTTARDKKLVQLAGEYAVASELCRRGWAAIVMPEAWPGFDIMAQNADGQQLRVQVKTKVGGGSVFFPTASNLRATEFNTPTTVFVRLGKAGETARFFCVPGEMIQTIRQNDLLEYMETHPNTTDYSGFPPTVPWKRVEEYEDWWDLILEVKDENSNLQEG